MLSSLLKKSSCKFMKTSAFLLMLLFSLSCYAQDDSIKIDVSINRAKSGLFVKVKNESNTFFILPNGRGVDMYGSIAYIKAENDGIYYDNRWKYLLPATGEVWYKKKIRMTPIRPNQEIILDILGIDKELLLKDKLYVKLYFVFREVGSRRFKRVNIEKWVPVE